MKKKTIRPMGQIYLELEKLVDEMIDDHDVQWGDILYWLFGHLVEHRPDAREEYTDGSGHPVFYYGPKGGKNE